jgi:diaminopimelate epimerase
MRIKFTKMHGLGNDFIVLHDPEIKAADLSGFCRRFSDRRFGIGFDQALILRPSDRADVRMEVYNADGSRVEMCGNGVRCVATYLWDRGLAGKGDLSIETPAGSIRLRPSGDLVEVDMGEPVIPGWGRGDAIPATGAKALQTGLVVDDGKFDVTRVSMGNPHAVIFVPDVASFPVERYGPSLETHPLFPDRTNVEFVQIMGPGELRMRVWERGTGETLACGTGACAAAVAAHLNGLTSRKVLIHLNGGDLRVHWSEADGHVLMTGPAVEVFEGEVKI